MKKNIGVIKNIVPMKGSRKMLEENGYHTEVESRRFKE